MSRFTRPALHRISQWLPRFERFESRYLLSLSVIAIDPIPNAHLTEAPADVIVTFDRPIDPTSLSNSDIELDQVGSDGSLTWLSDATEAPGPGDNQIELTPGEVLAPGHYRTILQGDSPIAGLDGVGLDGTDQTLGDFWVVAKGVGLGDAVDLGTPGSTPTSTPGVLDFQTDPETVNLYKITLPAGHFWRLGLEVTAQRNGGTLASALALFDAQGNLIAADELGRSDYPNDPYLFAGVDPGVYYIGVSGEGNIPGTPLGYDPATATPGSVEQTQPGGPYTLDMVADPEDTPTQLLSLTVDQADPLDPSPTGLSLEFSGAIRLPNQVGGLASYLSNAIEVVDQGGHVWPVTAVNYIESDASVSFLFNDPLPPGDYTVRLPEQGGLVDLAGLSPVAPGQPAGVLGTFSVKPSSTPQDPYDLGALFPDAALAGVTVDAQLSPGDSVSYRFVITFPSIYTLTTQYSGGSLAIAISSANPDLTIPVDPGKPDGVDVTNDITLTPGVYELHLTANGSQPVLAHLVLGTPSISVESILQSGIGQGPGLSLRLIAPVVVLTPVAPTSTPTPIPIAATPTSTPTPIPIAATPTPTPTPIPILPSATTSQQVPSALGAGLGADLVGRPSPEANQPATVVLGSQSGAMVFAQDVLIPQGIGSRFGPRGGYSSDGAPRVEFDVVAAAPTDRAMVADSVLHDLAHGGPLQLNESKLGRLGSAIARWFETRVAEGSSTESGVEDSWTRVEGAPHEAGLVPVGAKQSGITSSPAFKSAVVILIILAIYRMYRWLNREWRWLARRGDLTT